MAIPPSLRTSVTGTGTVAAWRLRSSISLTAEAARSWSSPWSRSDQRRGMTSTTPSVPTTCPCRVTSGTPAYAIQPSSRTAGVTRSSGCRRASSTTRGWRESTTWRQKEKAAGESRRLAQGSGNPVALLKNWRSSVTSEMKATGAPSRRAAMRVRRSKASSGGVSSSAVRRTAASRSGALDCTGVGCILTNPDTSDSREISGNSVQGPAASRLAGRFAMSKSRLSSAGLGPPGTRPCAAAPR